MKSQYIIFILFFVACSNTGTINNNQQTNTNMKYKEQDILNELDIAFKNSYKVHKIDNKTYLYKFFIDLEHGYFNTANSKIHLYADELNWAIVFETNGYQNRGCNAQIQLIYIGNCIKYEKTEYPERTNLSNFFIIGLISEEEFKRVENKTGTDMEQFELISPDADSILVRNEKVSIEKDKTKYAEKSITFRDYKNPNNLIAYKDLVRYLSETEKKLMSATEDEIKEHIPSDIPKLMTIESFHYKSMYEPENLPSTYETFQQIAKVLTTKDTNQWSPTLKANNHWSNWKSGGL